MDATGALIGCSEDGAIHESATVETRSAGLLAALDVYFDERGPGDPRPVLAELERLRSTLHGPAMTPAGPYKPNTLAEGHEVAEAARRAHALRVLHERDVADELRAAR
jgi:hypothetical protein